MKAWTIAGTALVLMSGMGLAVAQQAPAAPPPPPAATAQPGAPGMDGGPGPRGPMGGPMGDRMGGPMGERMGGPGGWRHRHMGDMPPPPPPSKAAHFRLRKDGAMIDVKCAETEPTKACVDAAVVLMDKAAAQR